MGLYLANDTDLTTVANTIRGITGRTTTISFPGGFNDELGRISTAILENCNVSARLLWPISLAVGENILLNWNQYELVCDGIIYDSRALVQDEDFLDNLKSAGWSQYGFECISCSWGTPPDRTGQLSIEIKAREAVSKSYGDPLFSNYAGPFAKIIRRSDS